jgi:hypothetical protein
VLRRPLDQFLRTRDLKLSEAGVDQNVATLARVTEFFIEAGFADYAKHNWERLPLSARQCSILSKIAFAIGAGLASSVGKPQHAQLAAALAVATFFTPRFGTAAAARLSVEGMVWRCLRHGSALDRILEEVENEAVLAVARNEDANIVDVVELIRERIAAIT